MAKNTKPTELNVVGEDMTAEERLVQKEQEMLARIAQREKEAAEREQRAQRMLDEAMKEAAGVKVAPAKTFRQEMAEAEKLSMKVRAERQFGTEDWVTFIVPAGNGKNGDVMSVTVNGIGYDLACGAEYTLPRTIKDIAYASVK